MPITYLAPWFEVEDADLRAGLQRQYDLEIGTEHVLWQANGRVVGKSGAHDDILVALPDGRYAIVHLTWTGNPGGATWPDTVVFETADAVTVAIARDHADRA